jgi:hypothetical protein
LSQISPSQNLEVACLSQPVPSTTTLSQWVENHDESLIFVVCYVGLAVSLSIFVSLFWLVVIAGVHFTFELWRQSRRHHGAGRIALEALWEIRLDVVLVLSALVLALYIDSIMGLLGLRSAGQLATAARSGARIGIKASAWDKIIRSSIIVVDDGLHLLRVFLGKGKRDTPHRAENDHAHGTSTPLNPSTWTLSDRIILTAFLLMLVSIPVAPVLTEMTLAECLSLLATELHPLGG